MHIGTTHINQVLLSLRAEEVFIRDDIFACYSKVEDTGLVMTGRVNCW